MASYVINTTDSTILVTDLVTVTTIATPKRDQLLATLELTISGLIILCALFGNLVVVNTLWRKRKTLTRMHFFIYHLCIADIISALGSQLPLFVQDITVEFYGPTFLCKLVKYLALFPIYLSSYILVLTAFDRYLAICHPLLGLRGNQKLRMRTMVAVVWILAAIFASPQLYFWSVTFHEFWGLWVCWIVLSPWMQKAYPTAFTLLIFVIPSVCLVVIYGQICLTVWQNMGKATGHTKLQKYVRTSNESWDKEEVRGLRVEMKRNGNNHEKEEKPVQLSRCHTADARVSRAKIKTIKMTLTIVTVYIICWTPFFFQTMYGVWAGRQFNVWIATLFQLMANINCCTNPWIYLAFSGNVLGAIRELFFFCKPCLPREHIPLATTTAHGDEPSGRFAPSPAGPRTTFTSSAGTDNKVDTNANSSF
ncbi:Cephalotocin receptor 1 [Holothuria leucospilota]|uniref:Cephalotocin receptor 1 n=1 Tax=Holothuria leucospilota TaxID=206669 RepID=A0A9Q1B9Q8_HOLLE|nr:Cephalotocin receptor 1 [Holothuria leucospilota]